MQNFLASLSLSTILLAGAAVIVIVNLIFALAADGRVKKSIRRHAADPESPAPALNRLSQALYEGYVLKRAERGFRGLAGPFPSLPRSLGYAERWIPRVLKGRSPKAMALLLRYAPERGLFDCFLAALASPKLGAAFVAWLEENRDGFPLRSVALSGPGRNFDGDAARALLADRMDGVREMLGDQEWAVRVMALRILAGNADERSVKGVADCLRDPHPLVRKLAIESPQAIDKMAFFDELYTRFTSDPSYEVRKAAKARILSSFIELYTPDTSALGPEETIHVLELLDPSSRADEEVAYRFLEKGTDEERLAAAEQLQARGALADMLATAPGGDRKEFERRLALLSAAAKLQVSGFLSSVETIEGSGPFEMAARILAESGDRRLVATLAQRWFALMGKAPYPAEHISVYRRVLEAIRERADEKACALLAAELIERKGDNALVAAILAATDGSQDRCVFGSLQGLFLDPGFPLRDELRAALLRQPKDLVVPFTLSFLRAERHSTPRALRRDALILAGELGLKGALQRSVESLPTLDADDIAALAPIIVAADAAAFKLKARYVLASVDAPARAAIIAALPATGERSFLSDIKTALKDADPDVRVAAARALASFQETKALATGGMDLLRDPVERVRIAAAAALAEAGGASVVEGLKNVLNDANEVDEVKASVITGLGQAGDAASLELLCDRLEMAAPNDNAVARPLIKALAHRRTKKDLARLIERLKDATGELKARIAEALQLMGSAGENSLVELLNEDIASLKPYLVEALESLGYVEARIRELKHRDPAIREDAAQALDRVGSRAAFRGIVLAARDPDQAVRIAVTKALERLAGPEGESILAELEKDPDARVRKYVLWAMERVKAKSL
ncbi:MAG TPA: hypothetical protein DCG47_11385 [Spirochaetaceae bacterium]|nr:hypothetical protein [Spirochaetaceae bacterium]